MKGLEALGGGIQAKAFRSLPGKSEVPASGDRRELARAAQDFEALFVRQLLSVMRRSVPEGDPDLKTPGSDIYRGMLDDAFADQISRSGRGLGLAEMLLKQFEGRSEASGNGSTNE